MHKRRGLLAGIKASRNDEKNRKGKRAIFLTKRETETDVTLEIPERLGELLRVNLTNCFIVSGLFGMQIKV